MGRHFNSEGVNEGGVQDIHLPTNRVSERLLPYRKKCLVTDLPE